MDPKKTQDRYNPGMASARKNLDKLTQSYTQRPKATAKPTAKKKAAKEKKVSATNMHNKAGAGGSKAAKDRSVAATNMHNKAGAAGSKAASGRKMAKAPPKPTRKPKVAAKKRAPARKKTAAKKKKGFDFAGAISRGFGRA